jgi:sodium transport system permease protein
MRKNAMNLYKVLAIFRKEVLDLFRDRKTLIMMILVPLLMYPVLFTVISSLQTRSMQKMEQEKSKVAVQPGIPGSLLSLIRADDNLTLVSSEDYKADIREKMIQGYMGMKTGDGKTTYTIYYDGAWQKSSMASQRLNDTLKKYLRQVQENIVSRHHIEVEILDPFFIEAENVASQDRMMGMVLGLMLPFLLIMSMLMGTMYPSIDLIAGEKERGSMETILTTPVNKLELLAGKFLTVASSAVITGILNLFSMMMTFALGLIQLGAMVEDTSFSLSILALLMVFILIIPIALFISAAMLGASIFSRNFKDAQNTVSPVLMVLMLPSIAGMIPGVEINDLLAMVPMTNVCLLFKEIFLNNFPVQHIVTAILSNSFLAVIGIVVVSKLFNAEQILFAEEKGISLTFSRHNIREKDVFEPGNVLIILSVMVLLIFYFGTLFQIKWSLYGVIPTEILLLLVPTVLLIWFNKVDFKESLNLKGFRITDLMGTVIATVGIHILVVVFAAFMNRNVEEAVEFQETFIQMIKDVGPMWAYVILAFLPAVCEEVVFRGITFSSLKKRMKPQWAIIITGLLFGLFHLHFFRIIPTAMVGIFMTYLVYRSGSIFMGIVGHFINNGLVVMLVFSPPLLQSNLENLDTGASALIVGIALVFSAAGIGLMEKGKKRA